MPLRGSVDLASKRSFHREGDECAETARGVRQKIYNNTAMNIDLQQHYYEYGNHHTNNNKNNSNSSNK